MRIRYTLMALGMLLSLSGFGQTSAYQCLPGATNVPPGQSLAPMYEQTCIVFEEETNYLYQDGDAKVAEAIKCIVVEPGFEAGPMQGGGSLSLQLVEQPEGYDVFLMSGTNMGEILRYKKVEFGIQLPTDLNDRIDAFVHPGTGNQATPLNPYLESGLDIEMTFTHSSGLQRHREAFYYQDFKRNHATNDWDELATDHPMRVRFAPGLNGTWTATTRIKVSGVTVADLLPFQFEVIESGDPGFVTIHSNKRNLQRNNRIIYPVGHNFPHPVGNDVIWGSAPSESNKAAKVQDWVTYLQHVQDYADLGGQYIRTLQSAYSALIEFEVRGNYTNRLHYAWETDNLIEKCENEDLLVEFNLMQQEPLMKYANFGMSRWDFGNWVDNGTIDYNDPHTPYCYYTYVGKEPREMFTDPTDLEFHKQRTRYYLSRYGYSPQIYAFEIVNEPFHLGEIWEDGGSNDNGAILDNATVDAIFNYHDVISKYIRHDLKHKDHLIAYNLRFSDIPVDPAIPANMEPTAYIPELDILSYNPYTDHPDKLVITKTSNDRLEVEETENSMYARNFRLHEWYQKPVLYSETGHIRNRCSNYAGHYKDVMSFGFTGAAGFNMWSGFDIDPSTAANVMARWTATIRAQDHMNGNDVIYTLASNGDNEGDWQQGREYNDYDGFEKIKEHQFYVSSDKLRAVGYIYNRTFNLYTTQNPVGCEEPLGPWSNNAFNAAKTTKWYNNKMEVHGLSSNKWYTIDLYTYKEGLYWDTKCVKTNWLGKLVLEHEPMKTNQNPLLWYVIRRNNCNNKTAEIEGADGLEAFGFELFPNPSNGTFDLLFSRGNGQAVSLEIYDMFGKKVLAQENISEAELSLDTGLPSGMYLIRVTDGQHEQTRKFIIQ